MPLAQHAWRIRFDCSLWPSFWRTPAPVRGSEPVAPPSEPQAKRIQRRERSGPQARESERFHRGSIHRGSARFHTPISPRARAWAHLVLAVPPSSHPLQQGHALQPLTPAGILPNSDAPFARLRIRCRRSFRCAFRAANESDSEPRAEQAAGARERAVSSRIKTPRERAVPAFWLPGGARSTSREERRRSSRIRLQSTRSADPCPARVGCHAPRDSPGKAGWWRIRKTNGHSRCLRASRRIRLRLAMPRSSGGKGKNSGHTQKGREPWLAPLWKEDREQGETTRPRALRWIRLLQPAVCPYTPGR
jgi:hypothetical protein